MTTYDEQQVKWAADIINAAKRPLVYFGGVVRSAASCQPLRPLCAMRNAARMVSASSSTLRTVKLCLVMGIDRKSTRLNSSH